MFLIRSSANSPYFNLAAEEFLLKNFDDDIIFIYVNAPSVIIGKHQNTLNEVNYHYIKENGIDVVRRISGGGTVYHDFGNINFCFIKNGELGKLVDFKKQTLPVIGYLKTLGLSAEFKGHNDLRIEDFKISGNAEHVFKKRVLHHGTLLFNSELDNLLEAIKFRNLEIKDKAVKSVRASVKNISEFLTTKMSSEAFSDDLIAYFFRTNSNLQKYEFSEKEKDEINALVDNKFSTWDWNYGYSPGYQFCNSFEHGSTRFCLDVKKGVIKNIEITSTVDSIKDILSDLKGLKHKESDIGPVISKLEATLNLVPADYKNIMKVFF